MRRSGGVLFRWDRSNRTLGMIVAVALAVAACAGPGGMVQPDSSGATFTEQLNGVFFINASEGWVVGNNGTLLHTRNGGATWTSEPSGTTQDLKSVRFSNDNTGWIVGNNGTILQTISGGLGWIRQNSGTENRLNRVFFNKDDTQSGWAVGDNGTILHTANGGFSWVAQTGAGSGLLNDVFFKDSDHGWIVGDSGLILYTDSGTKGAIWSVQVSGTTRGLTAVYSIGNTVYAVGDAGTILLNVPLGSGGASLWVRQPPTAAAGLLADVFFADASNGWIVGDGGMLLQTTDGGKIWVPRTTRTDVTLRSVYFIDSRTGWTVGDNGTILHTVDGGIFWIKQFKM